jgi:PAS domain S-box-containing protein
MPELLLITTDALLHDRVEEVLQDTDWSVHWERSEHIPAVLPDESFIVLDSAHPEASTWNAPATRSLLLVADHPDRVRGMLSVYHDFIVSPIDAAEFRQRLQRMRLRPPDGPSYEYADMFASTSMGIVVVRPELEFVYANPRAFEIIGHRRDTISSSEIMKSVVASEDMRSVADIFNGIKNGEYPRGIDLTLQRRDGTKIICRCSFSPLLGAEDHAVISFEDVTDQRETEEELLKTMEFLESLIDASVDAIVAADMDRDIVLFNPSAERISGRLVSDVLGMIKLEDLLGRGPSDLVMQRLLSEEHGGSGRLEPMMLDLLDVRGQPIPVQLSASLIYEHDEPSAIVLIFADLRDQIRVEQRLAEAQKKLAFTEKQAVLAELAGTAAHELNQPLTSMMAYAELLLRKSEADSTGAKVAEVLIREAERMAEIVRKIGKITRYETTSYVGGQKIFDLDRASGSPDEADKG